RGFREGGAEQRDGRDAAALELDRVGDADRGRRSAIAEALHDAVAAGERGEVVFAEVILGRVLAHGRPDRGAEPAGELPGQARQKEIRVELAVIDEAEALAAEAGEPGGGRNWRGFLAHDRIEDGGHAGFGSASSGYSWIQVNPTARPSASGVRRTDEPRASGRWAQPPMTE